MKNTKTKSAKMDLRFSRRGVEIVRAPTYENINVSESITEVAFLEGTLTSETLDSQIAHIRKGDEVELYDPTTEEVYFHLIVDHAKHENENAQQRSTIQARGRAALVLDTQCRLTTMGSLEQVVAEIVGPSRVGASVEGFDKTQVQLYANSASAYAVLRALSVSLGGVVRFEKDDSISLKSVPQAQAEMNKQKPFRLGQEDILSSTLESGSPIIRRKRNE